jgi:hypothetical protein
MKMPANSRTGIERSFEKYLDIRFKHIDDSTTRIETLVTDLKREVDEKIDGIKVDNEKLKAEIKADNEKTKSEIKADNKVTRWWIVGTALTVLIGFAAIAVSIFFGFSQLQTSWIPGSYLFCGQNSSKITFPPTKITRNQE